ncbi:ERF superfamily protein [Paracoccus haematequi]|uniref:ERF superfamily protein n=1 Tax=Paracoccus haematequi TaxID=2491866 RepID=A0A3S4GP83_9RHOB|nr:ERF family protein [Paracoccus haematequi]VDS07542.1 ERF superfamily protein [Paracoccus haematequi]
MNAIAKHDEAGGNTHLPADPMVSMIERLVLNPDADLDKLERMLALKRDHDRDNARISFARALAAARSQIPPIMKDATVDFRTKDGKRTHYQHETLAGIAKVIDPILSQFGLSYRFRTDQGNGGVRVTCIIAHADGHSEETSLTCAPDGSGSKNPFQAVGSAVTYLQRYTLKAALGLSAEVDDDAQSAAPRRDDAPTQEDHKSVQRSNTITADQYRQLQAKADEAGVPLDRIASQYSVEHIEELHPDDFTQIIKRLNSTIKSRKPVVIDANEIPY